MSPSTSRSLPTMFQDRAGISLYDAQYTNGTRGPIPEATINDVLIALKHFKTVCSDFGVPNQNIRILATEATRTAENSEAFRSRIKNEVGWEVDMLPKESEGRIGAMGIASSCVEVQGLVMDLGGGSTQITWISTHDGNVQTSPVGSISFPYGAAALTHQLADLDNQKHSKKLREELLTTMTEQFRQAFNDLQLPESLRYQARHGGMTLYLSGGGFRGWGYLLMSQHKISPYPIPIINGFSVMKREFQRTSDVEKVASEQSVFRISKRRAAQVPAVSFLINALMEALPCIREIRFCQGGIREGYLFDTLPTTLRALDPLEAATYTFSTEHTPISTTSTTPGYLGKDTPLSTLLWCSLPGKNQLDRSLPESFITSKSIVRSLANTMYHHSSLPKETRALSAIYFPITGALASTHGLSHPDRAILGLTLNQRWDENSDLPPPHDLFKARLSQILTQQESFWCNYLGRVAALIGSIYPAGYVPDPANPRVLFKAEWTDGLGKKGLEQGVKLRVIVPVCEQGDSSVVMTSPESINGLVESVEAVGKKKNRVGGKEFGFGVRIQVNIERH